MKIGITATRAGLTPTQLDAADRLLLRLRPAEIHQGCAVGGDCVLTVMAHRRLPGVRIVGHPPDVRSQRSRDAVLLCHELRPERPPLERNANIVAAVEALLACPAERSEQRRGGTWSTVRAARKAGKPVWLVMPEGDVVEPEGR